jgi:hypothetical protein
VLVGLDMPCKIEEDIGRREIRIAEQRIVDSQI